MASVTWRSSWSTNSSDSVDLQIEVECSARHVELHAEGLRRNLLGEEEQGEVAGLAAMMAGVRLGGTSDVEMMLEGFQQTLEREMETKIARVIDAKLATLSQRLAFSEQALFQLHKKMDAKDVHVQASLDNIQQKFSQLEHQLSQFNIVEGVEKKESGDMESKQEEQVDDADSDDEERKEMETASTASP
eukprot:jgi/Phyca11/18003/fgenesh1_pg.PHYCAscaffold_32_\